MSHGVESADMFQKFQQGFMKVFVMDVRNELLVYLISRLARRAHVPGAAAP
jgi:hypothetical protein